jgi:branched-chain amino acid transport system substrate-binding protein
VRHEHAGSHSAHIHIRRRRSEETSVSGSNSGMSRRTVLKTVGAGAVAIGGVSVLGACGSSLKGTGGSSSGALKIGYVSPQTGPLAGFGQADEFVVEQIRDALKGGLTAGGKKTSVQIVVKDSQSNPNRAADVARQLIFDDKVDIVVVSSTPDTVNPVSDQCEANGVPCVATISPWESWYFGRGAKEGTEFGFTTIFYFGMNEITNCFVSMWDRMSSNKKVATLWPNDSDANAFRQGFPPVLKRNGYTMVDGGSYQNGISDYSAQIARFKGGNAELFTSTPLPPDFNTFWKQAAQQGYKPRLAAVAKVMLFPSEAEALGPLADNIATDVWWSPVHPYSSTLDGTTAGQLAGAFTAGTGKQWTQALGSVYALFEIAVSALKSADDPRDRKAVASELKGMKIDCMGGPLDFTAGPVPGVAVQKLVGAQWRKGKDFPWDLVVVDNTQVPTVPVGGDLLPTG